MKTTGLVLTVVAMTLIASRPAFADVVPPKSANRGESGRVRDRLTMLGVTTPEAQAHVDSLTPVEVKFFAADTERVQVVGGLHMTEWVFGLLLVGVTLGIYLYINSSSPDGTNTPSYVNPPPK